MSQSTDSFPDDTLENDNPFKIPSDRDVFLIRLKEREEKDAKRQEWRNLKIWEKTSAHRIGRSPDRVKFESSLKSKAATKPDHAVLGERRREKENMADFIEKKREMFLVQMSLDTKRDEIRKLEEKAQMKEQALLKSELMLEEDALRFDAFLKENDIKAHEAIKRHEKEVKEKQEKISSIKKLNQEIAKVKSEMDKYNETLAYCRKYKAFLDELTPKEWFIEQQKQREHRKEVVRQYNHCNQQRTKRNEQRDAQRVELAETRALIEQSKKLEINPDGTDHDEQSHQSVSTKVDVTADDDSESALPEVEENSPTPTPPPELKQIEDGHDDEMYFTKPEQLLNVFATLEERNLFLIQNAQETEEAFDELKGKFEDTRKTMEAKTSDLEQSISEMNDKIKVQEDKATVLRNRSEALGASGDNRQQKLLDELGHKVATVFAECGFDPEQTPDTLGKLAKIEQLLEDLILKLDEMPESNRKKAEKRKEAERRDRLRREKVLKMEKEYEERLKRSLQRAKRVEERVKQQKKGKPVMFRSAPIRKKKKKQSSIDKKQQEQQRIFKKFFT